MKLKFSIYSLLDIYRWAEIIYAVVYVFFLALTNKVKKIKNSETVISDCLLVLCW